MSLPFARLALPGEVGNKWPEPSLAEKSRYFHAKIKHALAKQEAKGRGYQRNYPQIRKKNKP